MILKIFLIMFLIFPMAFASKNTNAEKRLKSSLSKVKLSKKQVRLGLDIKNIYKLSQKNILNKKIISKVHGKIKKQFIFKEFQFWTKNLLKIASLKRVKTSRSLCSSLSEKSYSDELKAILNENLLNLCFNKYIQMVSKNSKLSVNFHKSELRFMKFHMKHILNKFNSNELEYLLTRFKRNSKKHQIFSNTFLNYYIAHGTAPSKSLIQHMALLPKHTRYLQSKDLDGHSTKYIFYKELRTLKEKAFQTVDSDSSKKEIEAAFNKTLNYYSLTIDKQPTNKATLTLLSISKSYLRRGHIYLARKGLKKILEIESKNFNDAIFDYMWTFILEKDFRTAITLPEKYNLDQDFFDKNPKTYFWLAKAYKELGDTKKSKQIFSTIIKDSPVKRVWE